MRNLKTIENRVLAVLKEHPEARNDDMKLYLLISKACIYDTHGISHFSFEDVMSNYKAYGIGRRFVMKKYEYMTVDLSAEPSFNVHIKLDRYIEKLNEYGKQGWRLISGTDDWKYSIFEREIDDEE